MKLKFLVLPVFLGMAMILGACDTPQDTTTPPATDPGAPTQDPATDPTTDPTPATP